MKLYATVSSERASKGQGGNKFIRIDMTAGSATAPVGVGMIEMRLGPTDDFCEIMYYDRAGTASLVTVVPLKGEKQKGEGVLCSDCKAIDVRAITIDGKVQNNIPVYCDDCLDERKGD